MATKINNRAGNPRHGQSYTVSTLPDGRRVHTYANGQRVVVGKKVNNQNPAQNVARMAAAHQAQQANPVAATQAAAVTLTPAQRLAQNPNAWQDSGYNTALAGLAHQRSAGLAGLQTAGARAGEDHQTAMQRLAEAQARAREQTTSGANKQGLFYSGQLGKRLGEVDQEFGRQSADLNTAFRRGEEDRVTARTQLDQAFQQAQAGAAVDAWERFIAQAQDQVVPETPLPAELQALILALQGNLGG